MLIISHRGNINGANTAKYGENHPDSIRYIFDTYKKISVEIDIWKIGKSLYLGHDKPEHKINFNFLQNLNESLDKINLFIHCKNLDALNLFNEVIIHDEFCYFWHEKDAYALTSFGYIWTYPTSVVSNKKNQILVTNTILDKKTRKLLCGVCTDYVEEYLNY